MLAEYLSSNETDKDGNPTGGKVTGTGLLIEWQNGPLGRGADRKEPNGAFVETVIDAATPRARNAPAVKILTPALTMIDRYQAVVAFSLNAISRAWLSLHHTLIFFHRRAIFLTARLIAMLKSSIWTTKA